MAGVPNLSIQIISDSGQAQPLFAGYLPVEFALDAALQFVRSTFSRDELRDMVVTDVIGLIYAVATDADMSPAYADLPAVDCRFQVSREPIADALAPVKGAKP
ncbi:hypothetical protein [Nitrospirillum amazonense]|uniref:hypothetical protein n=1 Tax=Nitrospirillum amazonense TaxID=28077 RepID=UPI0024126616|nr:hypothetical protein [Nitrospirillum amazonense]MDG3444604.1 hypothetical protein [Nitrospirillum amazonense]